jgi:hypothetical protein
MRQRCVVKPVNNDAMIANGTSKYLLLRRLSPRHRQRAGVRFTQCQRDTRVQDCNSHAALDTHECVFFIVLFGTAAQVKRARISQERALPACDAEGVTRQLAMYIHGTLRQHKQKYRQ